MKLLLLLFQATCRSYRPVLEALLFEGLFRYDEVFVAEAYLIFKERKIITVLRVFVYGLFIRANLPVFPFILFGDCPDRVFIVFGSVQSIIFCGAGVVVFCTM